MALLHPGPEGIGSLIGKYKIKDNMEKIICGIQQVGIGVRNVAESWKWYKDNPAASRSPATRFWCTISAEVPASRYGSPAAGS